MIALIIAVFIMAAIDCMIIYACARLSGKIERLEEEKWSKPDESDTD